MPTTRSVTLSIITVHPTVTIVRTGETQTEIPTAWFPVVPVAGQEWKLQLSHEPTDQEKLTTLNAYLIRD